jgi:hypothetical protein
MLLEFIATQIAALLTLELFFRSAPLPRFLDLAKLSKRSLNVLTAKRASDHWKERALSALSARIFVSSMYLGLILLIICLPLVAAVTVILLLKPYEETAISQWSFRLLVAAISVCYATGRRRLGS